MITERGEGKNTIKTKHNNGRLILLLKLFKSNKKENIFLKFKQVYMIHFVYFMRKLAKVSTFLF